MRCMFCGNHLSDADYCLYCGEDVTLYKKIIWLSNSCYNSGLARAKVRDLSGAIVSLKQSLKLNKWNIPARNLLGLIYYSTGDIVEALTEWIISKNLKSKKNIASDYINELQSDKAGLDLINMTIKKYNQAILYCDQESEDMAIIQLKKVVSMYPSLLKGHQLLALLYIQERDFEKAGESLAEAEKIDATNATTLYYMREVEEQKKRLEPSEKEKKKMEKEKAASYKRGNETIIQPVSLNDNSGRMAVLNIIVGMAVGAALIWFLVVPATGQSSSGVNNKKVVKYNDEIASQAAEIKSLQNQLDTVKAESDKAKQTASDSNSTIDYYTKFVAVVGTYQSGSYDPAQIATSLADIDSTKLSAEGQNLYATIKNAVASEASSALYNSGYQAYGAKKYDVAIQNLTQVVAIDEGYKNGDALYYLALSYEKSGDVENARTYYQKVLDNYPNTNRGRKAKRFIEANPAAPA